MSQMIDWDLAVNAATMMAGQGPQISREEADDVVAQIVYSGQSQNVRDVLIDGRLVMRHRELRTLDLDAVLDAARTHAQRIADLVG